MQRVERAEARDGGERFGFDVNFPISLPRQLCSPSALIALDADVPRGCNIVAVAEARNAAAAAAGLQRRRRRGRGRRRSRRGSPGRVSPPPVVPQKSQSPLQSTIFAVGPFAN